MQDGRRILSEILFFGFLPFTTGQTDARMSPASRQKIISTMPESASTPTSGISASNASSSAGETAPSAPPPEGSWRRSYWALNITQFQGAFSANAFQNLLLYMVLRMGLTHAQRDTMVPLIPLFFSVPLILFSMPGGFLADHFSKRQVIILPSRDRAMARASLR
jgi:hypothetical protein